MTAIEFKNIGKQYRLGLVSTKTISHDLKRWWTMNVLRKEDPFLKIGETNDRSKKGNSDYVWALKDITFNVDKGDVLGIIGKNGAGKSTLLKILSRVTSPSVGTIKAKGRIASLLEVGTGFHPEMTGRENIFMNGSIMGMTKPEIRRKLDEIVDFAGVERYVDTPVKRYSSGMMVRLGFAIAAHLEPEILVVDEVLAVGDAEFQKKAIGKMQDVSKGEGRTVLFVSHNMASIRNLCNKGVVLENGKVIFEGGVSEAINEYLIDKRDSNLDFLDYISYRSSELEIKKFTINNKTSDSFQIQQSKRGLTFHLEGFLKRSMSLSVEFKLYDPQGVLLATYVPGYTKNIPKVEEGYFAFTDEVIFPKNITKGTYFMNIEIAESRIDILAVIDKKIEIEFDGLIGDSGFEFLYKNDGLLII